MQFGNPVREKLILVVSLLLFGFSSVAMAGDLERRQAKRMHDRIAGVPPSNAVLNAMEADLVAGNAIAAAQKAMNNPGFYNVTLKNFVTPWTNEEQTVFAPLNDYSATVIGMIRDNVDFRKVLYGDILYIGVASGLPAYSDSDNNHYLQLENLGPVTGNLADPGILVATTQSAVIRLPNNNPLPASATAGVMTTRAAARAYLIDGTNRAMFRFTLLNYFCDDLETFKDETRIPDHIHQDVSRSPGGDSRIFLNRCIACHAGMDGMMGAFAHYQYEYSTDEEAGRLNYTPNLVQPKFLINANNFITGHITTDDSWVNYWRNGKNSLIGWGTCPGTLDDKGNCVFTSTPSMSGAKALGMELSNTHSFAQCQVKKVFKTVCLRDPDGYANDRAEVKSIVDSFASNNGDIYMKDVFAQTAVYCKGN